MVSQELESASNALTSVFESFDPVSIIEGATGLGVGIFTGDFVAQIAQGFVSNQSNTVQFIMRSLARIGTAGVFLMARRYMSMPLAVTMLGLAAVGSGVTWVLDVVNAVASTGAKLTAGKSVTGAPQGASQPVQNNGFEEMPVEETGGSDGASALA